MKAMTIGQTRDGLSQIIELLFDGSISACVMKDGSTPMAKTAPI